MSSERIGVMRGDITINDSNVIIVNKRVAEQVKKIMDEEQQARDKVVICIEVKQ